MTSETMESTAERSRARPAEAAGSVAGDDLDAAAQRLVAAARTDGVALTGPDGLLGRA